MAGSFFIFQTYVNVISYCINSVTQLFQNVVIFEGRYAFIKRKLNMDREQLNKCIALCRKCTDQCSVCAEHCRMEGRTACERLCRACTEECEKFIALASNNANIDAERIMECADACRVCAEECEMHADAHCILCAEACRECESECNSMLV